jgi:hypothetical protein
MTRPRSSNSSHSNLLACRTGGVPTPRIPGRPRASPWSGVVAVEAMTAVNIARISEHPLHVIVIDDRGSVGRGTAYGLRRPEYLLNVAARNMYVGIPR